MNAQEWCDEIEEYMKLTRIVDEKEKLAFARTYLSGAALAFLKLHLTTPPGEVVPLGLGQWSWFRPALIRQFQPLNTQQYVRDQLRALQQDGRRVAAYVIEFTRLTDQVPSMGIEERLGYFRAGLHSRYRWLIDREILPRGKAVTIEDAAAIASAQESTDAQNRQMSKQKQNQGSDSSYRTVHGGRWRGRGGNGYYRSANEGSTSGRGHLSSLHAHGQDEGRQRKEGGGESQYSVLNADSGDESEGPDGEDDYPVNAAAL
jgi:hypothetical protein